jgi:bifunctional non-homologous end joining protein LigD
MSNSSDSITVVGGKKITLSNLGKVLYPAAQFTKAAVIDYYRQIAPVLLPHLKNRALTLKRYPNGSGGKFFYEKHCPSYRPIWMKTVSLWSEVNQAPISYCVVNDLASLIWLANLAALELHVSLARAPKPDVPTAVVFDLDPGPGTDVLDCAQVALWLRELLLERKLQSFPKTSGSKGLQIYVPLNTTTTFDLTKQFARSLAERLTSQHPEKIVAQMSRSLRTNKVYIDWVQNDAHKTTVCAYSLRAREQPTVSTPVSWEEVESALQKRTSDKLVFTADAVIARVKKMGDLFAAVNELKQKLPKVQL